MQMTKSSNTSAIPMPTKRYLPIFLLLSVLGILSFVPKDPDPIEKLVASLQRWAETNPQEKVYLHTDKPYYVIGDTIWLKAYVTTGSKHQLSALSGALYIDLINEGDSLAQSVKLPLISGMAKGSFILSDTVMREGNYRLRAYTQWMRNAGQEYFYDRTFSIGNAVDNTVFAKIDYLYTKDGANTKVRVLLKYTDETGKPYINKTVHYELKESYKIVATGSGKTNELGELSINLPNPRPGVIRNSYLLTRITFSGEEVVLKTFPVKTVSLQTDVQFFPESGNLVNGIRTRVAFKATGVSGLGIPVKGIVTDNGGTEITRFESKHLGMGYFSLMPEAGKTYQAKITFPDGSANTIKLPDALNEGYGMSVYNNAETDTVLVRLNANTSVLQTGTSKVSLLAQSGGEVLFATDISIRKASTSLYIPVKDIPSGILQFTLFSSTGDPLNERIIFVQNKDGMQLQVSSIKKGYSPREKIELNLEATDHAGEALAGNFSVSVISEAAVPSDEATENSIFSQLLLSSDIKGYIEKPNYYFHHPTDETRANLDVLMMAQGYRRFIWKDLIAGKAFQPVYKPEKLGTDITGRLIALNKKPVSGGKVTLMNNKLGFILDTITDNNGRFGFKNLLIADGVDFTLQGRTGKNGKNLEVELDKMAREEAGPNKNTGDFNAELPEMPETAIDNGKKQNVDLQKAGRINRVQQLREVQVKASKKWGFGNSINESQADQVFRPDSKQPCQTLRECLEEMERNNSIKFKYVLDAFCGVLWVPFTKRGEGYAVLIDNMIIDACDFQTLLLMDPSDINKIYFVHESYAIQARLLTGRLNFSKPPPVMAIYTKSGNFRKKYDPSVVYYKPKGFDNAKEFYSPRYDNPKTNIADDLRTTIYWNPAIMTDKDGKAKFDFFNADNKGTYRVVIEGINGEGQLGRQVYRYEVK